MPRLTTRQYILAVLVIICLGGILLYLNKEDLLFSTIDQLRHFKTESDALRDELLSYGNFAPLFFIVLQIIQVILAPIPGEASGLVGGYLFGTWPCFIYSSIGLTIGSAIAFGGGRLLSSFFTAKFQHTRFYEKFNYLVSKGDYVIPFFLFIFPGFPKDSLSYLLGMSSMPLPVFLFVATIGRMPGTLMLSAYGAEAYDGDLIRLTVLTLISAVVIVPAMLYRHRLLELLKERQEKKLARRKQGELEK